MKVKMVDTTITFLEMKQPAPRHQKPYPHDNVMFMEIAPTISFYRYLYNRVGGKWYWFERHESDDMTILEMINHPDIGIFVLYVNGCPAGFAELDGRSDDIELVYFGLMPEFIGKGFGSRFLQDVLDVAWSTDPTRVWLHTCDLDHPRALSVYQRAGFVPYDQERKKIEIPFEFRKH